MKKASLALLLTLIGSTAFAQKFDIVGTIIEKGTTTGVPSASVRVLSLPDSSMVTGASTTTNGSFKIQNVKKGKYALKVTFVGYRDHVQSLDLTNKSGSTVNVGNIEIVENSKLLKDAVVSANAAQVQVSGDSLVYNASAYRVPEGSTLEALVKKLPGAEVDDDGNIKINGKTIKKILVDKKEFFLDDKQTALQNLPSNIIDKIKSYDRKSDFSRITGIDDGEDETVLDLQIKKGMAEGWMSNLDLAAGTEHRYSGNLFARRALTDAQFTLIGNANNVGGRGFGGGGGRGGWGRGGNGLSSMKNAGFNFATTSDKLETGGSVMFRYNGNDLHQETNTQNLHGQSSFGNEISNNKTSNISLNGNLRFEWKPDSMTNIMFRPRFTYSRNRGMNNSVDATFVDESEDDVETRIDYAETFVDDSLVLNIFNTSRQYSQSWRENKSANGELQINRRLSDNGRNLTFRFLGSFDDNLSKNLSSNHTRYGYVYDDSLKKRIRRGNEKFTNRYTLTPEKKYSYTGQVTYSEPIAERTYLQLSYQFNYNYSKNDRGLQSYAEDLDSYNKLCYALQTYRYDIVGAMDYMLSNGYLTNYDDYTRMVAERQSQFSEYRNYTHTIGFTFRKITDMYNLSAGVELVPQHSTLNYKFMGKEYNDIKRTVFNYAPRIDFRYNFDKQTQLRTTYSGHTSQPSMESLLDIEDDSDDRNKKIGNPGLKPSFQHSLNLNFNTYNAELQQGIFVFGNASLTQNSFAQEIIVEKISQKQTTKQTNINGNWNGMIGFGYNRGLGEKKYFTVNTFTMLNYTHNVGLYFVNDSAEMAKQKITTPASLKQKTNNLGVSERLSFGFRKDWFEISVNGNVNYSHAETNIGEVVNPDTWNFSVGSELNLTFDNGLSLSTDISESCRRGYQSSAMNTNELVWNAQIGYSFLKGKALTITAQWNDILGQQSAISRTISTNLTSESRSNSLYSYGMVHVIYKLNVFGKGGFGGFGGFGGGFNPGGFGGGRPGGGGFGGGRGGRRG